MTETLHYIKQSLEGIYPASEIRCFTQILMEHVCGIPPYRLLLDKDKHLSDTEKNEIRSIIARLRQSEPLQYILGEARFFDLSFFVKPGVLIPRPETEELAERIISAHSNKKIRILDIGTGSGCIAITLARHLPEAEVYAVDISEESLHIAHQNAERNQVNVQFIHTDILKEDALIDIPGNFTIIVSNPPYVKESEKSTMDKNVLAYEPHLALFVPDADPLRFYKAIAHFGKKKLNPEGFLYFEINAQYGKDTVEMLQQEEYTHIKLIHDLYGKDRITEAQR